MLVINGKKFKIRVKKDEEDLWESALCSDDGEKILVRYGETHGEAKKELWDAIRMNGWKEGVDNQYVDLGKMDPEARRKIDVAGKRIKGELMGQWLSDSERYELWKELMKNYCPVELGYGYFISL